MEWFLTYEDAEKKVAEYLKTVDNLTAFCKKHDFCYNNVNDLRSLRGKYRYTNLVFQILKIMGFEVEKKTCFILKDINIIRNEDVDKVN